MTDKEAYQLMAEEGKLQDKAGFFSGSNLEDSTKPLHKLSDAARIANAGSGGLGNSSIIADGLMVPMSPSRGAIIW